MLQCIAAACCLLIFYRLPSAHQTSYHNAVDGMLSLAEAQLSCNSMFAEVSLMVQCALQTATLNRGRLTEIPCGVWWL